jgi:hypothetical protein
VVLEFVDIACLFCFALLVCLLYFNTRNKNISILWHGAACHGITM